MRNNFNVLSTRYYCITCNYFPQKSVFHQVTMFLLSWGYICHWIAFYFRLRHVFMDTAYQISKCYNYISIFIICLLTIIFHAFIIISAFIFGVYNDLGPILAILDTNDHIVSIMTKYTLLSVISMIGTIFYIIIVVSVINESHQTSTKYLINIASNQFDVVTDTISASLTLTFYDKYYKILCIKCDYYKQINNRGKAFGKEMSNIPSIKDSTIATVNSISIHSN